MYGELRSAYDRAFEELARETQHLLYLQSSTGADSNILVAAREKVTAAEHCYLQTRNALADYLLSSKREHRLTAPVSETIWDQQQRASIAERAYFFWENAGKPSGNDKANWHRAEARYPRALSVPCGGC
jgi:hypothetical protein